MADDGWFVEEGEYVVLGDFRNGRQVTTSTQYSSAGSTSSWSSLPSDPNSNPSARVLPSADDLLAAEEAAQRAYRAELRARNPVAGTSLSTAKTWSDGDIFGSGGSGDDPPPYYGSSDTGPPPLGAMMALGKGASSPGPLEPPPVMRMVRQARQRATATVRSLPDELMVEIFAYVDAPTLVTLSEVCQDFRRLAAEQSLWRALCFDEGIGTSHSCNWLRRYAYNYCERAGTLDEYVAAVADRMVKGSSSLSKMDAQFLVRNLPVELRPCRLMLLYSSLRHGYSMTACMNALDQQFPGPTVMVIRDTHDHIFGCYASDQWRRFDKDSYGDGTCFLFSLYPTRAVYAFNAETRLGRRFQSSSRDGLSMGGRSGMPALFIDDEMNRGRSLRSMTFRNPVLSHKQSFQAAAVEIFGIQPLGLSSILRPKAGKAVGDSTMDPDDPDAFNSGVLGNSVDRMLLSMFGNSVARRTD